MHTIGLGTASASITGFTCTCAEAIAISSSATETCASVPTSIAGSKTGEDTYTGFATTSYRNVKDAAVSSPSGEETE